MAFLVISTQTLHLDFVELSSEETTTIFSITMKVALLSSSISLIYESNAKNKKFVSKCCDYNCILYSLEIKKIILYLKANFVNLPHS